MKWKGKIDNLIRELSVIDKQYNDKSVIDLKVRFNIQMFC